MTEPQTIPGFSPPEFEAFLARRQEPAWLVAQRREAWVKFLELPLPDRKQEEWRRTNVRDFRFEQFHLPASNGRCEGEESGKGEYRGLGTSVPSALLSKGLDLSGRAVFRNSWLCEERLDPALADRGVLFGSLDRLIVEHEELLRPYLLAAVDYRIDKFAALSAACWSGGTLLYVPKGVVLERPVHVLSALSPEGVDLGRTLIVLEEAADATVLAETASTDASAAGLHCGAVEIHLGPGARLRYVDLQDWGNGVWHFAHQRALVGPEASLQWTVGALGGRLAKVNQQVALVGPGAQVQLSGVMFTEGRRHLSYNTLQHHKAPHCTSDLLYKGALQDDSRLLWRGMIKVDRDAQKTNAYQRDDNLILSEGARADSIPGLEIEADDVKCSHGATAGRVDDEQVFYACCRGLPRQEAVRMIVAGFFQQAFDRIALADVRQALSEAIGRRVREYQ